MLPKPLYVAALVICALMECGRVYAQKTILVPSPGITTIQQAIDEANTGDTVLVAPGTYVGNFVIDGKEITLTSQAGPDQTILMSASNYSTLWVHNTPSLATTISGFTIEHHYLNPSNGDPCGNYGDSIGVGQAGVTIRDNVFSYAYGAAAVNEGAIDFEQNTVDLTNDSPCPSGVPLAAGLWFYAPGTVVSNGVPAINTVSDNTFTGNIAGSYGVQAEEGSSAITIDHNRFQSSSQAFLLQDVDSPVIIENNVITSDTADAVEIDHTVDDPPSDPATTFLINNTIYEQYATSGPEIKITGTYSRVALIGNILSTNVPNQPILSCAALSQDYGPPTPIILDHNLFFNASGPLSSDTNCPVPIGSFGNLNADPKLVSTTDLHLTAGSPAIDAGTTGFGFFENTDFDGNPRVQDGSGKGFPQIDIGAYEFTGKVDQDVTSLVLTSSAYYLVTSNDLTLTAQLTDQTQSAPLISEPVAISTDGGPAQTVNTDSAGEAILPLNNLQPGLHTFTASYAGGLFSSTQPAAPAVSVVLYVYVLYDSPPQPTRLTITSSPNPSALGAAVQFIVQSNNTDGMHPGPVALSDDGTLLQTLTPDASGMASYTTSSLTAGTHTITATFAGDALHEPASASLTQTVLSSPDFSLTSSTSTLTVQSGQPTSTTLTISSLAGFAGTVHLSCGTLTPPLRCSFANATPQLTAGATVSTQLGIQTASTQLVTGTATSERRSGISLLWLCPFALLGLRRGVRRRFPIAALALLLLPAALALTGCTNITGQLGAQDVPAGTYIISVQGTATINGVTVTHTLNLTLVVTS